MDTIEPAISPQLLENDDETGAVQVAPPVVAVVVTTNPGPWLEEALTALADWSTKALLLFVGQVIVREVAPRAAVNVGGNAASVTTSLNDVLMTRLSINCEPAGLGL